MPHSLETLDMFEEKRLRVFEKSILRRVYGPIFENGEWRKYHNEDNEMLLM